MPVASILHITKKILKKKWVKIKKISGTTKILKSEKIADYISAAEPSCF
jgi:hypothetical protein